MSSRVHRRNDARDDNRRGLPVDPAHRAAAAAAAAGVAHQPVNHPRGDAGVLQPRGEGMPQVVGAAQVQVRQVGAGAGDRGLVGAAQVVGGQRRPQLDEPGRRAAGGDLRGVVLPAPDRAALARPPDGMLPDFQRVGIGNALFELTSDAGLCPLRDAATGAARPAAPRCARAAAARPVQQSGPAWCGAKGRRWTTTRRRASRGGRWRGTRRKAAHRPG
jgi:hypothetical protein